MQKLIDEIHRAFLVLITPGCWLRVGNYSQEWDDKLNELMKREKFKPIDKYTVRLGNLEIWIGNHPYASFELENCGVLPRRSTAILAHEKMIKDLVEEAGG